MTQTAVQTGFNDETFESFVSGRTEPEWLLEMRREAWAAYQQQGWPTGKDEEWMRTDIRLFKVDRYAPPSQAVSELALPPTRLADGVELAGHTHSIDSRSVAAELTSKWESQGVLFGSLSRLVEEHGDVIKPHLLQRAYDRKLDRFAALHTACWSGGTCLYVPRGVVVDQPFHAYSAMTDGGVDFGHTLVILEEGAEATLLAESTSFDPNGGGLHCGGVELIVAPNAHLRFVSLQDWGFGVWHFAQQRGIVDTDASLQWTMAAMGSKLAKVNQSVALVGQGAYSQVNGVLFTEGKQHLSYHTEQHHVAPHCTSDFLYKSALQDASRTVWRGMITVDHDAQKTDGYQRNDNLLLSTKARADSIPGLEIEADDVRCTHGSTTSKIDEELIFYAMCRGYTRKEAARMIVTGFFQQIFDRISIESVRESLGQAISRKVREYE